MGNWIAKAKSGMQSRGTVGAFGKQADQAGESTQEFATDALKPGSKVSPTTKKRAQFAKNIGAMARKKKDADD